MPRLPRWLRPFAQFRGEDHLAGNPGIGALKANVLRVLERDGIDDLRTSRGSSCSRTPGSSGTPSTR